MFLKDSWISTLKVAMRSSLRDMSKGWYNLYETNWEVYLMSKLRKLMELLKSNMGDRKKTAGALGISTTTLWRRMKRLGINHDLTWEK